MGLGEMLGMRWILWGKRKALPDDVWRELARIIQRVLEADA